MRRLLVLPLFLAACSARVISYTADAGPARDVASPLCTSGACPDAGAPRDVGSPPDPGVRSYDYVVNRFVLDPGAEPPINRGYYGFNVDAHYSPPVFASQQPNDCRHGDYFSVVDPDQNMGTCTNGAPSGGASCRGGVDNQFPNFAQTLQQFQASVNVERDLNANLNAGRTLWIVRVSGVDGALGPTLNDPSVDVKVYEHVAPLFADCADVARPGQMYAIDDRSLLVAGDLDSARLQFDGVIVNGRLRVTPPATAAAPGVRIPLAIMGSTVDLPLRRTQLRLTLDETAGTLGNLGGYTPQTEFFEAFVALPALMQFRESLVPLIQGFVDVATGTTPLRCEHPDGAVGLGIGFSAVRAVVASMTVTSPPRGMCGAP